MRCRSAGVLIIVERAGCSHEFDQTGCSMQIGIQRSCRCRLIFSDQIPAVVNIVERGRSTDSSADLAIYPVICENLGRAPLRRGEQPVLGIVGVCRSIEPSGHITLGVVCAFPATRYLANVGTKTLRSTTPLIRHEHAYTLCENQSCFPIQT